MNVYWFSAIFILWYAFSLIVSEYVGKKRKIGEEWSFFLCFIFTPIVGLIISLLTKPKQEAIKA